MGHFSERFAGAERELPDLADCMHGLRETQLWSDAPPHSDYARHGVRAIQAFGGVFPRGGTLLLGGVHVRLGPWLAHAGLVRVVVRYNLPNHSLLFHVIEQVRAHTGLEPELCFASHALQRAVGLPGWVEPSLIVLDAFLQGPVERPHAGFTVGRASRDVLEKHDPEDVTLYRMLAARGHRVRIMGGICLAPQLGGVKGIELLPTGAEPVPEFFRTLDAMLYRTGTFTEPYGRIVFEAMASGLPVVASTRGGFAEFMTHGVDSLLVSSQEEAWNALEQLAASPKLRRSLGATARQTAQRLHGPELVQAMQAFYAR